MGWLITIALRIFTKDRARNLLILTITVGVMALSTVLSIMNGFQFSTIDNLLNIDSYHLIAYDDWGLGDSEQAAQQVAQIEGVVSALPFSDIQTIANNAFNDQIAVRVRALPPDAFVRDPALAGALNLQDPPGRVSGQSVLIGTHLAERMQVAVGDDLALYSHAGRERLFTVADIFDSGYNDFDSQLVFTTLESAQSLLSQNAPVHIGVKIHNHRQINRMKQSIAAVLGGINGGSQVELRTWEESNRAIFGALRLEKFFMILTVGMIFVVVSISIYQSSTRRIMQRSHEIALLIAVGVTPARLRQLFTWIGLLLGLAGGVIGCVLGLLVTLNISNLFAVLERTTNGTVIFINYLLQIINSGSGRLAPISTDYFYFFDIPHKIVLSEFLSIFCFGVLLSTLTAHYAAQRVNSIQPAALLGRS